MVWCLALIGICLFVYDCLFTVFIWCLVRGDLILVDLMVYLLLGFVLLLVWVGDAYLFVGFGLIVVACLYL